MYGESDKVVFGYLVGALLGIADYYGEVVLHSGPTKRIFLDEEGRDVMIELSDGHLCYAKDSDLMTLDATYRAYKDDYPKQFEEDVERIKAWLKTWGKPDEKEN